MSDDLLRALQEGCFRYFQMGGRCISDPVGLLSGYIPYLLRLIIGYIRDLSFWHSIFSPWHFTAFTYCLVKRASSIILGLLSKESMFWQKPVLFLFRSS
jgi:hypothetical protein